MHKSCKFLAERECEKVRKGETERAGDPSKCPTCWRLMFPPLPPLRKAGPVCTACGEREPSPEFQCNGFLRRGYECPLASHYCRLCAETIAELGFGTVSLFRGEDVAESSAVGAARRSTRSVADKTSWKCLQCYQDYLKLNI